MLGSNRQTHPITPAALTAVSSNLTGIFLCTCFVVIIYNHTLALPNHSCFLSHFSFSILLPLTNHTASSCNCRAWLINQYNFFCFYLSANTLFLYWWGKKYTTVLNRAVLCDVSLADMAYSYLQTGPLFHCGNHRQVATSPKNEKKCSKKGLHKRNIAPQCNLQN